jgi:hypothetical protein
VVQLRGVNRSGTEYACIQGHGIFDGPSDAASVDAILAWKANAVRVPLNESCWLGLHAPAAFSGAAYQQALADYVSLLDRKGLYAVLELHWSAAGDGPATGQEPMPNRAHSASFWHEVAVAFGGQGHVLFELFNEPFPDDNRDSDEAWRCWRDGGHCAGVPFAAAGMQELIDVVRQTGTPNVILLGGVQYANALTQWLDRRPMDPLGNLAAAWHAYNFNACSDRTCYEDAPATVAAQVPLVASEIGEDDCKGEFIAEAMGWLDERAAGYLAWTWDAWDDCLALVADYDGTPRGRYGRTYREHLLGSP